MNVQTLQTPSGEEMVILSRADYEALIARVAELADQRAGISLARLETGEEELLTEEEVERSLTMHPLRFWREKRGMTQSDLARACDMQQSTVAAIESGARSLTKIAMLQKIAQNLGVREEMLLEG